LSVTAQPGMPIKLVKSDATAVMRLEFAVIVAGLT
jgi:hypothetical protein